MLLGRSNNRIDSLVVARSGIHLTYVGTMATAEEEDDDDDDELLDMAEQEGIVTLLDEALVSVKVFG